MKMPKHYAPMLATSGKRPFNNPDWQWEVKWDGYRMLAYVDNAKVELRSRNDKNYTQRFKIVADDLSKWKDSAIIDGEMVVIKENGISHFNSLENWYSPEDGELRYYVFDLLWLNGKSLLEMPLVKRRELLKRHFPKSDIIRFNECFDGMKGTALFEKAEQFFFEGIIGKKKDSEYFPGARTTHWVKVKVDKFLHGVIVGFTKVTETDRFFSRLLIAIPAGGGQFLYVGAVGSGFTETLYKDLLTRFKVVKKPPPFATKVDPNKATRFRRASSDTIYWVKPALKCLIRYQEITNDGLLRHPSFKGLISF